MGKLVVLGGAQKGDEGKGRLTDECGDEVDIFLRVNGGANAGHSLYVKGEKMVTHLIPSGATYAQARCFLGNDMVIDPLGFSQEITELTGKGFLRFKQLGVSRLAQLVMPYCLELEKKRENARGKGAIGTTGRGIGTTYEMQVRRLGLRVGDLLHLEKLHDYIEIILAEVNLEICQRGGKAYSKKDILNFLEQARQILSPYILAEPLSKIITQAKTSGQNILIEMAQGPELDKTHGTYPYVTSSSTIAGAACSGAGIGPTLIDEVIIVAKAYDTRVGGGPFLTEIRGELAELLRKRGDEYGATTKRPRRVGWADGPQLRHAARINGATGLVITKGDVLQGIDLQVCDSYQYNDRVILDLDEIDSCELGEIVPYYRDLGRFEEDISGCRDFAVLPNSAKLLFNTIAMLAEVPIVAISVGKNRGQTIMVRNPWH